MKPIQYVKKYRKKQKEIGFAATARLGFLLRLNLNKKQAENLPAFFYLNIV